MEIVITPLDGLTRVKEGDIETLIRTIRRIGIKKIGAIEIFVLPKEEGKV